MSITQHRKYVPSAAYFAQDINGAKPSIQKAFFGQLASQKNPFRSQRPCSHALLKSETMAYPQEFEKIMQESCGILVVDPTKLVPMNKETEGVGHGKTVGLPDSDTILGYIKSSNHNHFTHAFEQVVLSKVRNRILPQYATSHWVVPDPEKDFCEVLGEWNPDARIDNEQKFSSIDQSSAEIVDVVLNCLDRNTGNILSNKGRPLNVDLEDTLLHSVDGFAEECSRDVDFVYHENDLKQVSEILENGKKPIYLECIKPFGTTLEDHQDQITITYNDPTDEKEAPKQVPVHKGIYSILEKYKDLIGEEGINLYTALIQSRLNSVLNSESFYKKEDESE